MNSVGLNVLEYCKDDKLFRPWFKDEKTWSAWFAFLAALFAQPLSPSQRRIYEQCTGRKHAPVQQFSEVWLVVGRRGGKSFILALIAVFLACFKDWSPYLQPGERGTIIITAKDKDQARNIFRYILGFIERIPMIKMMLEKAPSTTSIDFTTQVTIEIRTASFRSIRGYTIVAALLDEIAFWLADDSANPDSEIVTAIRPGMATIPGAMMLAASSPYARRGILYKQYQDFYGKDDPDVLVWHASTQTMNPSVSKRFLEREYAKDPLGAAAEYGAQFRSDIESFLTDEVVRQASYFGQSELPYDSRYTYKAFTDPSGGSNDSFTLAIGHVEGTNRILDCVREVIPPFDPDEVVKDFTSTMKKYHITRVHGDRYGGEWPRDRFRKAGVKYIPSEKPKSDLYRESLPLFNSGQVQLIDNSRLRVQLVSLERRTSRAGRDSIDHPPGGHDDIANSVCGMIANLSPSVGLGDIEGVFGDEMVMNSPDFEVPV